MPNFDGFTPGEISRNGGLYVLDSPEKIPLGVSPNARNCRYKPTGVATRFGLEQQLTAVSGADPVTGLGVLSYSPSTGPSIQYPWVFDAAGNLGIEEDIGSGSVVPIVPTLFTFPQNANLNATYAYNRMFGAFSDLKGGALAYPFILDGATLQTYPVSLLPMGSTWVANTQYNLNDYVCPTTPNSHVYKCTTAGTSDGAQPAFPTGAGATVTDGSVVWTESTPSVADAVTAGNVCAGTHYFIVLFETSTGYIQGWGINLPLSWTAAGSKQATISNLPIGPSNTIRRIVAFAAANQPNGNAGPFFYIPANDTVQTGGSSISITGTVINDNATTTATFNFTDDYLIRQSEVTDYVRKIKVPQVNDVQYLKTINRMVYIAPTGLPSGAYISLSADPETVYGDGGLIQVAENNGERLLTIREFKQVIYAFKNNSGHPITPSTSDPSQWDVKQRWDKVGICGPRAIDFTKDFGILAHRTGIYQFTGDVPTPVWVEIQPLWEKVNFTYEHLIWVAIDEQNKEIHIGVPYKESTTCSHIFKLYYGDGWEEPVAWFFGRLVAAHKGRKWSLDDIAANVGIRAERNLPASPNANMELDNVFQKSQMLFGSSNPDGAVNATRPGRYDDNGAGIDWIYDTGYTEGLGVGQFGGVMATAQGNGDIHVTAFTNKQKYQTELLKMRLKKDEQTDYASGGRLPSSERFMVRFSNSKQPGAWCELMKENIYTRPLFTGRAG